MTVANIICIIGAGLLGVGPPSDNKQVGSSGCTVDVLLPGAEVQHEFDHCEQ